MDFSLDSMMKVLKMGRQAQAGASSQVGVAIYVDASATALLTGAVRRAFCPRTVAATVRVRRLEEELEPLAPETDLVVLVSCGSALLEEAARRLVVSGAPVVVVAESSVEVPFITEDTRLLGLVAATDEGHLLDSLARWVLERTDKGTAMASNFPFMRRAAAERVIASCAAGNVATGALIWPKGADFPVMTLAQMDMALTLAGIYGREIGPERLYELAGVLAGAYALRGAARAAVPHAGRARFVVRAGVAGGGTYAMGLALCELFEHDIDYTRLNEAVRGAVARMRAAMGDIVAGRPASSDPALAVAPRRSRDAADAPARAPQSAA